MTRNPAVRNSVVVVKSSDPANELFGTGFVISQDANASLVVTCTHVINDVGGPEQVRIGKNRAKVVASSPDSELDLAVLELSTRLENDPIPLSRFPGEEGLRVQVGGYSLEAGKRIACYPDGTLIEDVDFDNQANKKPGWRLKLDGGATIKRGYSGGPVVDAKTGEVVGVVLHDDGRGGNMGTAISILALGALEEGRTVSLLATVGREDFPEISDSVGQKNLEEACKIAVLPGYLLAGNRPNLDAAKKAILHSVSPEDALRLRTTSNLDAFAALFDALRGDCIRGIQKFPPPAKKDVEQAFFAALESMQKRKVGRTRRKRRR